MLVMYRMIIALFTALIFVACSKPKHASIDPNIIMIMSDDLGWGDTGFNGNKIVKTPQLDRMAAKGLIFTRFYTASPVCSPTRASCLTGRNPYRINIPTANSGHMKAEEVTLAEILKKHGYRTAHFGKWHLGTLTTKMKDSNRGRPGNTRDFSIPTDHGFQTFFSTEAKVPTYDPLAKPAVFHAKRGESPRFGWANLNAEDSALAFGTHYWQGKELLAADSLTGDDSKIIIDHALEFINTPDDSPYFVVVWLHAPHLPVVADRQHRLLYSDLSLKEQLYYGTISAMDDQIGRLWQALEHEGKSKNTMLWFCSDNGPENGTPGSSGPFRERKRSLYEGGVRVPAFCLWENNVTPGKTDFPVVTSDYLPTILDMLSINHTLARPIDGMSIKGAIERKVNEREKPIGFLFGKKMSWVNQRYKLISVDDGDTFELYDVLNDPGEQKNIAKIHEDIVRKMQAELKQWMRSVEHSRTGGDY